MGKNDQKKQHEITAFELAFKNAQNAQKKIDSKKKIGTTDKKETSSLTPQKSFTGAVPKKSILPGLEIKKQQSEPKPAIQSSKNKKTLINLSLKQLADEFLSLDVDGSKNDKQTNATQSTVIHSKEKTGRSQPHDGTFKHESDIVIGFDLGTSSSKIIIRDAGLQIAYAVPFDALACSENPYLIPTRIFINNDGNINLSGGENVYSNLKIHLMDSPERIIFAASKAEQAITSLELASAYMALVLRHSRDWFLRYTETIYKTTHIHWHINVGIPSQKYDNEKIRNTVRTIAMTAWRISRADEEINISHVKQHLPEARKHIAEHGKDIDVNDLKNPWMHPDFINTHPEVIMEVVSYARSQFRTGGLHLLIDIGATTLDIATFIIHSREGEDRYPLLQTMVERLGTMMLHNRRVQVLKDGLQQELMRINTIDATKKLPASAHYEIHIKENVISKNDSNFFNECSTKIGEVIRATKNSRDPYSSVWHTELPVFICGGGARLSGYNDMIRDLGSRLNATLTCFRGFTFKELPMPRQLHPSTITNQDYCRLAVAYGLSFTVDEIGEVIPESKIDDVLTKPKTRDLDALFVSKDMC